jgi:hypothetical protein
MTTLERSSRVKLTFRDRLDCLEASECLSSSAPICHESLGLFDEMTVTLLLAMHSLNGPKISTDGAVLADTSAK